MTASLPLVRKFTALMNRVTEALQARTREGWAVDSFDTIDAVPWFERWVKIRAELMATDAEFDDIAECVVPNTIPEGFIDRAPIMRLFKQMKDVADVLNHPTRNVPQISIDREGIFVGGQPFDAMLAVTSIIRAATKSITVVDGYVSEHTINLLGVKGDPVTARILTRSSTPALVTVARTFNMQFSAGPPLEIRTTPAFHDRFIAVDDADYYHFGHSIKDAAKRQAFMFSRIEERSVLATIGALIAKEWNTASIVQL
jgi:hypothetical protein